MIMGSADSLKRICSEKDIPAVLGETTIVKLLGLSRTTAYYLLQSEVFPIVRKGSRKFVRKREFLAWLSSQEGDHNGKAKEKR